MEKKYIKPIVRAINVEAEHLMDSSVTTNNRRGNGTQLSKAMHGVWESDEEEDY